MQLAQHYVVTIAQKHMTHTINNTSIVNAHIENQWSELPS